MNSRVVEELHPDVLILLGGKSLRMGEPKHSLMVGKLTLLEHLVEQIHIDGQLLLSGFSDKHVSDIPNSRCVSDYLDEPFQGPLSGIAAGLRESNSEYLLVLSCDVFYLPQEAITLLRWSALKSSSDIVCLKDVNGKVYPLIGLWHKRIVEKLESYLLKGGRRVMGFISEVDSCVLECAQLNADLCNINTPEQFKKALDFKIN